MWLDREVGPSCYHFRFSGRGRHGSSRIRAKITDIGKPTEVNRS